MVLRKDGNTNRQGHEAKRFVKILRHIPFCLLLALLLGGLASCTQNAQRQKNLKKQAEASRNVGEAYMGQGNYTMALKELLKAEKLNPDDPFLHNDLGLVYLAKKKPELAIKHFKKAVALNPDFKPAQNNLGTAYLSKHQWDEAIKIFKSLTDDLLYATPYYPLSNLGWAYYNKRDYHAAEKYYKAALKIKPDFIHSLLGLARTSIALGKPMEAQKTLEKTAKLYPGIQEVHLELARAYASSRNYDKALSAYDKVVTLSPESPLAKEAAQEAEKLRP